jgi:epoxyqueuosine reductase
LRGKKSAPFVSIQWQFNAMTVLAFSGRDFYFNDLEKLPVPANLTTRIKQCAVDAGFDLCGIAPIGDFRELRVFPDWIADGKHGEMKYMETRDEAGELKRGALARVAPWARSVIVCALNYNTAHPYSTQPHSTQRISSQPSTQTKTHVGTDESVHVVTRKAETETDKCVRPSVISGRGETGESNDANNDASKSESANASPDGSRGWISRYAWGHEDYHDTVLRRLRSTEDGLRRLFAETEIEAPSSGNSLQLRSYVDTGPLVERVYAKYAGIGWIGKNTCIINQQLGSWLFLGVILTSLDIKERDATEKDVAKKDAAGNDATQNYPAENGLTADLPAPDRCGTCTRCITACPTQAIVAPGKLDARLCISYLSIEKRGAIPDELRSLMGRHVFGCDICQDVCPWNRKAPVTATAEFEPRPGLVNPSLDWLAEIQPNEFQRVFRGSPVRRAKLSGLRRNAVIAMGNSRNKKFMPTLKKLSEDPDPLVAEHAHWALTELGI